MNMNSAIAEADKNFKISGGPTAAFLQAGYRECIKFKKDEFIAAVESFTTKLEGLHSEYDLNVRSLPFSVRL